jgi:hypothetical protein
VENTTKRVVTPRKQTFILYIVPDDGLINPKHVANAFERENKLYSD